MSHTDTFTGIVAFGSTAEERRAHDAELLEATSVLQTERSAILRFTGIGYVLIALAALNRAFRTAEEEASVTRDPAMRLLCMTLRPFFAVLGAMLRVALGEPQRISAKLRDRHEEAIRASVGAPLALHDPRLMHTSLIDVRVTVHVNGASKDLVFAPSETGIVLTMTGKQYAIATLRGEGEDIAVTHRAEPVTDVIRTEEAVEFRSDTSVVAVQDGAFLGAIAELAHNASGVMLKPQYTSLAGATTQTVRFDLLTS